METNKYSFPIRNGSLKEPEYPCFFFLGVPEAPEMPTVREVYATNTLVLWTRPRDGGKPITNYILEKREVGAKRWSRATRDHLYPATQYRVQDLIEGCEYEFRVMAENELGIGDPSPPSKPILAKDPIGQCGTNSCKTYSYLYYICRLYFMFIFIFITHSAFFPKLDLLYLQNH